VSVSAELPELLARTRYLLLDFDGPICAIFAGRSPRDVVLELLALVESEVVDVPEALRSASDPFDVLRFAASVGPEVAARVERAFTSAEVHAVSTAAPTPGAVEVIGAWREAGRHVAVVSNNSRAAVSAYLAAHQIEADAVVARTSSDPSLLKPNPHLVTTAIATLHGSKEASVFVGDSVSDVEAAQAAGIDAIGYANKPGKRERLTDAGATFVIDDVRALAVVSAIAR
jgi:phosphoglycolate phosphatase